MEAALQWIAIAGLLGYSSWLVGVNCRILFRARPGPARFHRRMGRVLAGAMAVLWASAGAARAHFLFVVPQADAAKAAVILSEDLHPDEAVPVDLVEGVKLFCRDPAGRVTPLALRPGDHAYQIDVPGAGTRVIYGADEAGVRRRGAAGAYLLNYDPKTIIGDPFDRSAELGESAFAEIVAVARPGGMRLSPRVHGKPQPATEVNVIQPDGTSQKVTTDDDGLTPLFAARGRYGAWFRHVDHAPGRRGEQNYDEVRHYATLVVDLANVAPAAATRPARPSDHLSRATLFGQLPEAASSFGAVACDGWLYVYGGHIAHTHSYSTAAVSGKFNRLDLSATGPAQRWEALPGGPAMQGMNLATFGGKIYRVGGMQPRNKPGDPSQNFSISDCAVYDPSARTWSPLPSLPEPRSSHDLAFVDGKLYIIGGWRLEGDAEPKWYGSALVFDPSAPRLGWRALAQPFKRRAFIAASYRGRLYVMGGFTEESEPISRVDVYDPRRDAWSRGPHLPGPAKNGFGAAACVVGESLYVSVADGGVYRLDSSGAAWTQVGDATPRIVHRLAPFGSKALVIGGAAKGGNVSLIESVELGGASR